MSIEKESLETYRCEIDAIDQKIVDLLAERQKVVKKVVSYKKAKGLPVYHPAREEDLISEKREQGSKKNLSPDFIEELFRSIIRQSRVRQASHMSKNGIRPGATILIVGGQGGMGQYFAKWFRDSGYVVNILDKDDWDRVEAMCENIDLALISVPIHVTEDVIKKLSPFLPEESILADITSIKGKPVKSMLKYHKGPVLGLHPLFGPSTSTMDKQIIVATNGRGADDCSWVVEQLSTWGSIIVDADADEHDEIMAVVQALRHFATFLFGQFLYKKGIPLKRTLEFSSPIYRLELGMVGRLFAQDPNLYSEIIFASPERITILEEFLNSMKSNLEMIKKGEKETFITEFEKISSWFGDFSEQALRESSFLINKLIERF